VVCYSPRHDVTLAELDLDGVDALLETWQQQMRELAAHPDVSFVLIFENKGEVVGVSNPHPHCQIYATNFTFKYIETELRTGRRHLEQTGRYLFQDILAAEQQDGRRLSAATAARLRSFPTSRDTPMRPTSRRFGAFRRLRIWKRDGGISRRCSATW
jgi:UDPglucose--hexose-1-phosphate uridylyltransferase